MATSSTEVHPSIHFNDTNPAAPGGKVNVAWQIDETVTPADVSANIAAPTLAADGDVLIATPTDGQVLTYEASSSKWKNKTAAGGSLNVNGSPVSSPNLNVTTPAPASGKVNVTFQVSGSSVSAEVGPPTTSVPGVVPALPSSNASSQYLDGTGSFSVPPLTLPSGLDVLPQLLDFSNSPGSWKNFSVMTRIKGAQLQYLPASFKVIFGFTAGTGVHVAGCVIYKTAKNYNYANGNTVPILSTTTVQFGGNNSINQSFGGTASTSAPFILTSDAISLTLDSSHDYFIVTYFDDDSAGSNFNVGVGFAQQSGSAIPFGMAGVGDVSGNKTTGQTNIPTGMSNNTTNYCVLGLTT